MKCFYHHLSFFYLFFYLFTANKAKVLYGLLREPDVQIALDDEEDGGEGDEKPKVCHLSVTNHSSLLVQTSAV